MNVLLRATRIVFTFLLGLIVSIGVITEGVTAQDVGSPVAVEEQPLQEPVEPADVEIFVSQSSLHDAGCDPGNPNEWQFNITGVLNQTPPASISVETNLGTIIVPLSAHNGNIAQYDLVNAGVPSVTDASATIFDGGSGNFVLCHRPCARLTPTSTATTAATETSTSTATSTAT
ncbi:MAG: hypothetical protein E6R14_08710, partial [Thermomicrobiales bacterium]